MKLDVIADALGREVCDDLWEIQGWWARWPGTGAPDRERQKQRSSGCDEEWASSLAMRFGSERHL